MVSFVEPYIPGLQQIKMQLLFGYCKGLFIDVFITKLIKYVPSNQNIVMGDSFINNYW